MEIFVGNNSSSTLFRGNKKNIREHIRYIKYFYRFKYLKFNMLKNNFIFLDLSSSILICELTFLFSHTDEKSEFRNEALGGL